MRRLLIAAGVAVVVGAGALVVALVNLDRFVDANRDRLAAQVRAELGREVAFERAGVSFRGGLGVRIDGVRIADDPRFGGEFLRAERVGVTLRLWPALLGRWEIGRITLRAPTVTVIRDAAGWNIDSLGTNGRRRRAARPANPGRRERLPLVVVGLLDVRDGEVRYVDRRVEPPGELIARRVRIAASDAAIARPIRIEARAELPYAGPAWVGLAGRVGPAGDPPRLRRMPVDLAVELSDLDAGALARMAPLFGLRPPRELVAAGPVGVRVKARGTIRALHLEAALDASRAELRSGRRLTKAGDVALVAELAGVRDRAAFAVERALVRVGAAEATATGTVGLGTPWTVDLVLDAHRAPLAALAAVSPALAGADVGGTLSAHLGVRGDLAGGELPVADGEVSVADLRIRRAADAHGIADLSARVAVAGGVARLPPARFRLGGAPAEVAATLDLPQRVLTLERLAGEPFGGTAEARGRIDFRDRNRPRVALQATAHNVALGPLLAAGGSDLAPHLDGRLDAAVTLAGAGLRGDRLRRTLRGSGRVDLHDGVVRGLNLADGVLGAVIGVEGAAAAVAPARLRKQRPELFGAADTRFEELGASVRIAGGRARTDDLILRTAAYTVEGRGHLDLDGAVDLAARFVAGAALTADVLASIKNARWATNAQRRIEVPFRVTGRFPDLRVQPDAAFLAGAVGRALEERARKDGGGVVGDALRGLRRLFDRR